MPLTVVTVVLDGLRFDSDAAAEAWLAGLDGEGCDELVIEALAALDRLLATEAAATGRPYARPWSEEDVLAARVGYADGDGAYAGTPLAALAVDARGGTAAPRRERLSRSAPARRVAAVLRGREDLRTSEILVPRISADLEAGRLLAAAAAIEVAVALTLTELSGASEDPDHAADMEALEGLLPGLADVTERVVDEGAVWPGLEARITEALEVAERAMRRVRVLDP